MDEAKPYNSLCRVIVIGPRSLNHEGGIETHCRELYGEMAASFGCYDISVCVMRHLSGDESYAPLHLVNVPTLKVRGFEKVCYSLLSGLFCLFSRPDLVHVHGLGCGFVVPILKFFGLNVIGTIHSRDYNYPKWNYFQRQIIKVAETMFGYCDVIITVSPDDFESRHRRSSASKLILNGIPSSFGATVPVQSVTHEHENNGFVLSVGRMTPEKALDVLIDGFLKANIPQLRLVMVGDCESQYGKELRAKYEKYSSIQFTGPVYGAELISLYENASYYIQASSHEVSAPLSLLEAMCSSVPVLASDIAPFDYLNINASQRFPVGDSDSLAHCLNYLQANRPLKSELDEKRKWLRKVHAWDEAARKTAAVYGEVCGVDGVAGS